MMSDPGMSYEMYGVWSSNESKKLDLERARGGQAGFDG